MVVWGQWQLARLNTDCCWGPPDGVWRGRMVRSTDNQHRRLPALESNTLVRSHTEATKQLFSCGRYIYIWWNAEVYGIVTDIALLPARHLSLCWSTGRPITNSNNDSNCNYATSFPYSILLLFFTAALPVIPKKMFIEKPWLFTFIFNMPVLPCVYVNLFVTNKHNILVRMKWTAFSEAQELNFTKFLKRRECWIVPNSAG